MGAPSKPASRPIVVVVVVIVIVDGSRRRHRRSVGLGLRLALGRGLGRGAHGAAAIFFIRHRRVVALGAQGVAEPDAHRQVIWGAVAVPVDSVADLRVKVSLLDSSSSSSSEHEMFGQYAEHEHVQRGITSLTDCCRTCGNVRR